MPGEQYVPDAAPVPEGVYEVFIADNGSAKRRWPQDLCIGTFLADTGISHRP